MINYEFPPIGGGASHASYKLAEALEQIGIKVSVLTTKYARESGVLSGDCIEVPCGRKYLHKARLFEISWFGLRSSSIARRWLKANKPDAIIAFFGVPSGWIAYRAAKRLNIPYLVSLRGADVPGFVERNLEWIHYIVKPLIIRVWRNSHAIIANSVGLRALALKCDDSRPIELIPNGVDVEYFYPETGKISRPPIKLLYVGRFSRQKGLLHLLNALKLLDQDTLRRIQLTLVGDGPDKVLVEKSLDTISSTIKINVEPWTSKDKLAKIYRSHDVFVFPSLDEGMPNVVLEALASGLPILGTNIPGTDELVKHTENGWLVAPASPKELADQLSLIVNLSSEELKVLGENSRLSAEQKSWSKVANAYLEILENK